MENSNDPIKKSIFLIKKQDYKKAEDAIKDGLKDDPKNQKLLNLYGWVLFQRNKHKEMIDVYKSLIKINPMQSFSMFYNLGKAYFQLGNYKSAIDAFEKTVEMMPTHKNALFYIKYCYEKLGDTKKSKKIVGILKSLFEGREEFLGNMSMQEGVYEISLNFIENLELEDDNSVSDNYSKIEILGKWTFNRKNVLSWGGRLSHISEDELLRLSGDGIILTDCSCFSILLNKDQKILFNTNFFVGVDKSLNNAFFEKNSVVGTIVQLIGPAKLILNKTNLSILNLYSNSYIRHNALLAMTGDFELFIEDDLISVFNGNSTALIVKKK